MPSQFLRGSAAEVTTYLSLAMNGAVPGNAIFTSYTTEFGRVGEGALAASFASQYAGLSNQALAAQVLSNLGITASTVAAASYTVLEAALATQYGLYPTARGQVTLNLARILSGLEKDGTFGVAAVGWNNITAAAFAYGSSATNTTPASIAALGGQGYQLTLGKDIATSNVFNAKRALVDGSGYLMTLGDDDVLTGTGTNPTLNVEFGASNDISDNAIVQPTLNGIRTVNIDWTSNDTTEFNFADADDTVALNVNRVTANNANVTHADLPAGLTNVSLADATRGGTVNFNWREDTLISALNELNLTLKNVRVAALNIQEGGDSGEDLDYGFETVNVTATGSNNIDSFTIGANTREDVSADNASQTINLTINGATEINSLRGSTIVETVTTPEVQTTVGGVTTITPATTTVTRSAGSLGAETINITANAALVIAADERNTLRANNDGIRSDELRTLTITGAAAVTIDGLDGHVDETLSINGEVGTTLVVDASKHTGGLLLGVADATASDANVSSVYANRADHDVRITTGSGNDRVEIYGTLAGDITTGAGNDVVSVNTGGDSQAVNVPGNQSNNTGETGTDLEGVSDIDTGEGDDRVLAADLLATANDRDQVDNTGFDDVTAATITTGTGADTVTVRDLTSAADWDNITITDGNRNDQRKFIGGTIATGDGADSVTFRSVAEGASINTGADDDTLTVSLTATATVLVGDTDADVVRLVTATNGAAANSYTDEVSALGVIDRVGAVVDGGTGTDSITFTESDTVTDTAADPIAETTQAAFTLVARDAELRGVETITVNALDAVTVTTTTTTTFTTGVTAADVNQNVLGAVTLNLNILNQIEDDLDNAVVAHGDGTNAVNDNLATDGAITVDIERFDSALTTVNLDSRENVLQTGPANELYEAGTATSFTIQNMREGVALSLKAQEATGVAAGALSNDSLLSISTTTGAVTQTAAAADVNLTIDYQSARSLTNSATLNVTADSGAFDLNLTIGATTTDTTDTDGDGNLATVANVASTTDDDTRRVENFTIKFADANAHSVNANGFGDVPFRGANDRPPAAADDVSSTASTSFTVWSAAAAGSTIAIDNVNADTIRVLNGTGAAVTDANVIIRVNAGNNYNIVTGAGTDTIDMRLDDVRSDDIVTAVDRSDTVAAGAGRDTLIVNGNDSLGTNDNAGVSPSTIVNDDVFIKLDNIETILIDTTAANAAFGAKNGGLAITIDEQAGTGADNTNVDTIRMIGDQTNQLDLVVGNNFTVASTVNTTNIAAGALLIDASTHTGATTLNIENKDDDTDIQLVNMDIRAASKGGVTLNMINSGSQSAQVEVRVASADEGDTFGIAAGAVVLADGVVNLNTGYAGSAATLAAGAFDKLVLTEGSTANDNSGGGAVGTEGAVTVTIADRWTGTAFTVDASALTDTDIAVGGTENVATGGATITVEAGDTANLTVLGTQNSDTITTGRGADTVSGNAGNDNIVSDEVTNQAELEVVTFAATYDAGDVITVTHNGQSITATIGVDGVTGAAVATAIAGYDTAGKDALGADNITTAGTAFSAATSAAAGSQLRLTGAVSGTDYTVTSTTNNAGDNTAQVQSLTLGADAVAVTLVFNGTTYAIVDSNDAADKAYVALGAAVKALGGTLGATGQGAVANDVFTITGPASGVAFPQITQTDTGALALTVGDPGTDQANPTVVTETAARVVVGAADSVSGGDGNDTIQGLAGADTLDGGAGTDTISYSLSLAGVSVDLSTNVVSGGDAAGDVITGFENVTGSAFADVLVGTSGANVITAGSGADSITAGAGSDTINGGNGADTIESGAGVDVVTLTEAGTDSAVDTLVVNTFLAADADIVTGFATTVDKIDVGAGLVNGLGLSNDGVAGTDVISQTTFALGLADANSTAGVVFVATNALVASAAALTALAGATAANIGTLYATLETSLLANELAAANTAGLDGVLGSTDTVFLVLNDGAGNSVILRITNTSTTAANTLTAAEVDLVGVFAGTVLAGGDFI